MIAKLLRPLGMLYGAVVSGRNRLFDAGVLKSYRSRLPVLSVGNVALGGSGKTPCVQYISRHIAMRGGKPAILLRGYGGSRKGPLRVVSGMRPEDVGDEALEHLSSLDLQVPVVVSRSRVSGARFIEKQVDADIVLLDDGLQHRYLSRDVDLMLVDLTSLAEHPTYLCMAPYGYLREPLAEGLKRASAVLLISRGEWETAPPELVRHIGATPCYHAALKPSEIEDAYTGARSETEILAGCDGAVLTAIARPKPLMDMLAACGANVAAALTRPDHHVFSEAEWRSALEQGGGLVFCTSKDLVKLKRFVSKEGQLKVLRLGLVFNQAAEEERFWSFLSKMLPNFNRTDGLCGD